MTEAKLLPSLNEIVADLFPVLLKTIWGTPSLVIICGFGLFSL